MGKIAVVYTRYHERVVSALVDGALEAYYEAGGDPDDVILVEVPGAFELPYAASALAYEDGVRGVVVLGCVMKGETDHHHHIASSVFHALADLNVWGPVPVTQAVLTVSTMEQALQRSGGKFGNKGREAMEALLAMLDLFARDEEDEDEGEDHAED